MWWGGFSEVWGMREEGDKYVLIPMWWGGFSEASAYAPRVLPNRVLIPMWWGGFSESGGVFSLLNSAG